jgi:hypothetical protein
MIEPTSGISATDRSDREDMTIPRKKSRLKNPPHAFFKA